MGVPDLPIVDFVFLSEEPFLVPAPAHGSREVRRGVTTELTSSSQTSRCVAPFPSKRSCTLTLRSKMEMARNAGSPWGAPLLRRKMREARIQAPHPRMTPPENCAQQTCCDTHGTMIRESCAVYCQLPNLPERFPLHLIRSCSDGADVYPMSETSFHAVVNAGITTPNPHCPH